MAKTNASFAGLNNGLPQYPNGGGYGPAPQLPIMRAPTTEVVAAGIGPIESSGQGFDRMSFVSHPPMGGRSFDMGIDAVIASNPRFKR